MKKLLIVLLAMALLTACAFAEPLSAPVELTVPEEEIALEGPADEETGYADFVGEAVSAAEDGVALTAANFPDEAFRGYLADWDTNKDGVLSEAETKYNTSIHVARMDITTLKGIELLPYVTSILCDNNQLTSLDLSGFCAEAKAVFTGENIKFNSSNMKIGNDRNYVRCDNFVEVTLNGKTLHPRDIRSISFAREEVTLKVGEKLQPRIEPADLKPALTYTAYDPCITVSDTGLVTAKEEGKGYVTATTANGRETGITIVVQAAAKPAASKPTRITLNKTKATLGEKVTLTLKATLTPANTRTTLTWTSNKPQVAKVNGKGKVTALKAGKATITVTTANGKQAKVKITVK